MALAKQLLPGVKSESARKLMSLLGEREDRIHEMRRDWMAAIAVHRERRERKKHSPSKREGATVAAYAKDADDIVKDLAERMKDDPDEKKIGFILFFEIEAFVSDENFWGDLLSGPPRAALRRIQRFRLETIDLIQSHEHIDASLAESKKAELHKIRMKYET